MSNDRVQKINQRLSQMQPAYKGVYKKAVTGKSLRACINAQCLMCCGYQRKEVTLCTDLACPLYAVRPYQEILQDGHYGAFSGVESKNSGQGYIG
jgi:hypothetical protein